MALRRPAHILRSAREAEVKSLPVVIAGPPVETGTQIGAGLKSTQINALMLERSPELLDQDIVLTAAALIHTYSGLQ